MPDVLDTAAYILNQTGSLSSMKLQRLCYYAQAWSLVWDNRELFPEDFFAWKNGPICKILFEQTKEQFKIGQSDIHGNPEHLSKNQKDTIDFVLNHYSKHDAQYLTSLTHLEDPWKNASSLQTPEIFNGSLITKDSIKACYQSI